MSRSTQSYGGRKRGGRTHARKTIATSNKMAQQMAEPNCLHWSCDDVADWIEQLGFPQYRECFTRNLINGRKLIIVDCSHLPLLGITDFEHMKLIARSVRELLGIEDPFWNRSISLPPREPMGMFLESKSITGPKADALTYAKFLKVNYK